MVPIITGSFHQYLAFFCLTRIIFVLYLFYAKIFSRCYLQLTVSGSSKEDSYGIALYFRGGLFSGHPPDHLRRLQSRLFSDALSLLRSGAAGHGASQNGLGNLFHKFCHLLPVSRAGCLADYRVKKCSGLLQSDYHSYKRGASRYVWLHAIPYRTCNSGCHQPHHEGERHSAIHPACNRSTTIFPSWKCRV